MPRLPFSLITRARSLHPLLPLLLRPCRSLSSASAELRWLRDHALANRRVILTRSGRILTSWPHRLRRLCLERARGKPLQYILGTQPFGTLEMLCRRGVLIPRPETETLTSHLASLLSSPSPSPSSSPLHILDLCTGTGCIPLHLHALLAPRTPALRLLSLDTSPPATRLARKNLSHNIALGHLSPTAEEQISFVRGDVFADEAAEWKRSTWDVVVSNPPYISPTAFDRTTSRSVRNYEPKSALVPSVTDRKAGDSGSCTDPGDIFYPRILEIAEQVSAQVVLVEVADLEQAVRVLKMVMEKGRGVWEGCEIWRDWPAAGGGKGGDEEMVEVRGENFRVKGEGNGRAVLAWRGEGKRMIGRK